jgi:hypothetical protein
VARGTSTPGPALLAPTKMLTDSHTLPRAGTAARLGFVLATVAWLLAAPAIECRAQEIVPSVTVIVPTADAGPPADPATASAPTGIGVAPDGAPEGHNRPAAADGANQQPSATSGRVPDDADLMRGDTWKQLYSDVLEDQTAVLGYSLQIARGHHWRPVLAVAGATAGLIALDPHDTPFFRRTTAFHGFNAAASGRNTGVAMALLPAAFYVVSAKRGDLTVNRRFSWLLKPLPTHRS